MAVPPVSQPLSNVVPVTVFFTSPGSPALPFNQGIIVGNSPVINSVNQRALVFSNLAAVTTAGFSNIEPEYVAASIYFGQTPPPVQLWIGRQDLTALQSLTVATTPATAITLGSTVGTGYAVGNIVSITSVTGSLAEVTSIGGGGSVTGILLLAGGQSATVSNNLATTEVTGTGTGLTLDVTAVGSTGGINYKVGDAVYINQPGGSGGYATVLTVTTGGVVATLGTTPWNGLAPFTGQGTGYSVGYGIPVVGGSGTGLDVNITAVGETPLQAMQACRLATPLWYVSMFIGSHQDGTPTTTADHEAIAGYIEAAYPASQYFYTVSDQATLNGSASSLPGALQALNYKRSNGTYSTVQGVFTSVSITANSTSATVSSAIGISAGQSVVGYGIVIGTTVVSITGTALVLSIAATVTDSTAGLAFGPYPNNIYACAAPMGELMGLNAIQGPGSYFSGTYKQMTGVAFEPLTQTQSQNICGTASRTTKGLCCNLIVDYGFGSYSGLWQFATQASGNFFDEILQLDMLANNIQNTVFNYFVNSLSVPITNNGTTLIRNLVAQCCNNSAAIGFIAPGIWQGNTIGVGPMQIAPGDSFDNGYEIYVPPVSTLTLAQFAARQMPIASVAIIEAGSGIYQAIEVYVQP